MDEGLVAGVIDTASRVIASGAISANGHGNVSLRGSGSDEMYFTTAPTLKDLRPDGVAQIGLDGTLRGGDLPPIQGAVVSMHTALYEDHPEVRCVIHTHSPYATPSPLQTAGSAAGSRRWQCSGSPTEYRLLPMVPVDRNKRSPTSVMP